MTTEVVEEVLPFDGVSSSSTHPKVWKADNWYVPVKDWTNEILDAKIQEQAANLARLPFVLHHVALMPDAHGGFGMPIGGTIFCENVVIPYGIGVDGGCGVQLAKTNLIWNDNFDKEKLKLVLRQIQRDVPTGFSNRNKPVFDYESLLEALYNKSVDVDTALNSTASLEAWTKKVLPSVGTLGGGNHFLEVQRDDENHVYFMLHSGSRNLGKQICDYYAKLAYEMNKKWFSELPHKELAYFPFDTVEGQGYWSAMNFALAWAEINRQAMMTDVEYAFRKHASAHDFDVVTDIHHNFAAFENHYGKNGIVHRKGAVRARAGETVLIPGSMGTGSYIAEGLGSAESFMTCQHGAGRAVGRKEMMRRMESNEVFETMKNLDIEFISNEPKTAAEEAPAAYKDIESVMANSADLVKPITKLYPLGVVKG